MRELSFGEQEMVDAQNAISKVLSLHLSQAELETLFSRKSLALDELTQSRSLSEIGMALIRADALAVAEQVASGLEAKPKEKCIRILGGPCCIRVGKEPLLELSIHQLEE